MRRASILLLTFVLGQGSCPQADLSAQAEPPSVSDTTLARRIDAFLSPYVRQGYWSGAVVVVRGDSVLHRAAYGLANVEHDVLNTTETRFGVASVSKAFTALAAVRLARAGVIDLDATIDRWLPRFAGGDLITVTHLIRHRSGIPDTDDLPWFRLGQRHPISLAALVDSLSAAGTEFAPGSRYDYSNGGYSVLAGVLSAATGLAFPEVLRQWVFQPAGMEASGDLAEERLVPKLAAGYVLGPRGTLVPGPYVHPSAKIGAGSAYTTIDDVVALYRALRDERLIPADLRDSLFRESDSPLGEKRVYFGGRGPSYTAAIQIFPGLNATVAALGNNYGRLNEEITDGLAGLLHGSWEDGRVGQILARQLPFAAAQSPPAVLHKFVGQYRHQWGFEFALELHGNELLYVFDEHALRTPMIALTDSTLVSPWQWAELEIRPDGMVWRWLDFPARDWTVERTGGLVDPRKED